jgi:hypothetical protein
MGVSGWRYAPAAFYPRERTTRYPLDRRLENVGKNKHFSSLFFRLFIYRMFHKELTDFKFQVLIPLNITK